MPIGRKKGDDSDSEDEAGKKKPGGDEGEQGGGGALKRGGGGKGRFDDDSDSDDEAAAARKEAQRKRREEQEAKKAAIAAKREKAEAEEILGGAGSDKDDERVDEGAGVGSPAGSAMGGALRRKDEGQKNRFAPKGVKADPGSARDSAPGQLDAKEDEDHDDDGSIAELLTRDASRIPWLKDSAKRREEEDNILMSLASAKKNEHTMAKVREEMRKQGLYVAPERMLLPHNVERAMQRVRARREHAALREKARGGDAGGDAGGGADTGAVVSAVEDGSNLAQEDHPYLVLFDPLKERSSRPAMRFDPHMPYLQYRMQVPVTNMDAVFGPAEPVRLLDFEIRRLTFTDHPLFTEEDFLAAELEVLWRKYKQRAEMKWVELYTQKIEDVKAALDTVIKERELAGDTEGAGGGKGGAKAGVKNSKGEGEGDVEAERDKGPELHQEVARLRMLRASEEFEDLSVVSSMIQLWERIKSVRESQRYNSTRVDLKFRKQAMDSRVDQANRDEELEAELSELRRVHEHNFGMRQVAWLEKVAKIEADIKRRTARARVLEDKVAHLNVAEAEEEDASDDEEEDKGGGGQSAVKKSAAEDRLTLKLEQDLQNENSALQKARELLDEIKGKEPKPTDETLDEDAERARILARQAATKRAPGSPLYIPVLTERSQRTETESLPDSKMGADEAKRRKAIKGMRLVMKVSVNGHMLRDDAGQERHYALQQRPGCDFSFTVNEAVQLAATSGNPEVKLHLFEYGHGAVMLTELATVFVPIAEDLNDDRGDPYLFCDDNPKRAFEPLWLESETKAGGKKRGSVGFGTRWGRPSGLHHIQGEISMKISALAALQTEDGSITVNIDPEGVGPDSATDARGSGGALKGSHMSVPMLKKMIQQKKLDPNDPRNRHLLELLSSNKEQDGEGFVRFDSLADMLRLGGDNKDDFIKIKDNSSQVVGHRWMGEQHLTIPATIRHKLLMSRQQNPALFAGSITWNPVPLLENEIGDDDLLNKVYAVEFPDAEDYGGPSVDDKKVKKVMQFRQKVQAQVRKTKAKHGSKVKRVWRHEDVVHQPKAPVVGAFDLVAALAYLFRKRTALRPEINPARPSVSHPTACCISVTVQRAHNLPRRRPGAGDGTAGAPSPLEVLVEARFGENQVEATPISKGNDPAWNTRLRLKFEAPGNNWSPSNLLRISDSLHLTVFDTKVFEKSESVGKVRKVEKRFLGSISFPFTTLYASAASGRIDGVFALDAPPHTIGYTSVSTKDPNAKDKESKGVAADIRKRPSLQVCVSLDPPLPQPAGDSGGDGNDVKRMYGQSSLDKRVRDWIAECSRPLHCRHRSYDALGRSLHRDWVLATRFVTPQAPPAPAYSSDSGDLDKQMLQLARFVGLIPFLDDFNLDGGEGSDDVDPESLDVWCTSNEFIDIMAGDWEEHATLLCNFFNYIFDVHKSKMKAYLVFGRGIPEGNTVYTMTAAPGEDGGFTKPKVVFWNASVGSNFSQLDPHCTLKEVFYVVSSNNVWGNMQEAAGVRSTIFDFDNRKNWKPLFTPKWEETNEGKFQKDSVQDAIDWRINQKHEAFEEELRVSIYNKIRGSMESWRSDEQKAFNEDMGLNKKLVEILKKMEQASHHLGTFSESDLHTDLDKYLQANDMTGFYINRPYTDISPIIEEIKNADIHHCGPISDGNDRDTKFSIAVHVKAFPRRIVSVWVAVACCAKKSKRA